jgi:EmrB/QacA subfamily drug resistance transporter
MTIGNGSVEAAASSAAARKWTLALASLGSLMVALDMLVVTASLSTIRHDLGASMEQLEWTVNAYSLSFAVLLMGAAALGDRFGRRRMFAAGIGLFVAASAACALAPSATWLIAARVLQGVGAAFVMPLAMALLSATYTGPARARALGIFTSITGLAVVAGPVVGGAIAGGIAWQWIFWLNVPIGAIAIPLVLSRMQESFGARNATLDAGGTVLITVAALGLVWGLMRGNGAGWGSAEVMSALAAGVVFAAAFVAWELRAAQPMVPMRLFRSRPFSAGNAAAFLLFGSLYGAVFFVAQFFQVGQGYGPLGAGLRVIPWTGCAFIFAPVSGALVNRIGERPLMVCGLFLQAVGFGWISLIAAPGLPYAQLVPPLMIAGCVSLAMPATQHAIISAVVPSEVGKASGVFNMLRQLGGVVSIAILVAAFGASGGRLDSAQAFSDGFSVAMRVCAGLSLAGALIALMVPGRQRRAVAASAALVLQGAEMK